MLIRSQDKRKIDTFAYAEVEQNREIVFINGLPYGKYSTEKKAIKVLDMIQEQYKSYSLRWGMDCSSYAVFQMPQDEDVIY